MHERRYARYGGWRRCNSNSKSWFGFQGPKHAGFGRYGMFGGYRSHYNYYDNCLCNLCRPFHTNISPTTITELPFSKELCNKKVMCFLALLTTFFIITRI